MEWAFDEYDRMFNEKEPEKEDDDFRIYWIYLYGHYR